jgi:class 3 adenylate cyclase
VVLPFPEAEFRMASVIIGGDDWGKRFDQVLKKAANVYTVSEYSSANRSVIYHYANLFMDGMATLRAQMLETELKPLVVWDGRSGEEPEGTDSLVQHWRSRGRSVEVVDVAELLSDTGIKLAPAAASLSGPQEARSQPESPQQIRAMLFADAVGYAKLSEEQIPLFGLHFLEPVAKLVAKLIAKSLDELLEKNTWGDALYFVFASVTAAGRFALDLRDLVRGIEWAKVGLPENLGIRIALHAGPVYSRIEPVTEWRNYYGSHVSLASRIEPITPLGQVYASQSFAALAAAQGVTEFTCDYVGQVPLAKGRGPFPMYHVRRRNDPE